jgi:hypothetical protein
MSGVQDCRSLTPSDDIVSGGAGPAHGYQHILSHVSAPPSTFSFEGVGQLCFGDRHSFNECLLTGPGGALERCQRDFWAITHPDMIPEPGPSGRSSDYLDSAWQHVAHAGSGVGQDSFLLPYPGLVRRFSCVGRRVMSEQVCFEITFPSASLPELAHWRQYLPGSL